MNKPRFATTLLVPHISVEALLRVRTEEVVLLPLVRVALQPVRAQPHHAQLSRQLHRLHSVRQGLQVCFLGGAFDQQYQLTPCVSAEQNT